MPLARRASDVDDVPGRIPSSRIVPDTPDLAGADAVSSAGGAAGHRVWIVRLADDIADRLRPGAVDSIARLEAGDDVVLDNTGFLASRPTTVTRSRRPTTSCWDQFRTATARPIYPQRPLILGPLYAAQRRRDGPDRPLRREDDRRRVPAGREAYPVAGRLVPPERVQEHLGDAIDDRYRSGSSTTPCTAAPMMRPNETKRPAHNTRIVSYRGALEQALRDLDAWAEQGVDRPRDTAVRVVDGQIGRCPTATTAVASSRWSRSPRTARSTRR